MEERLSPHQVDILASALRRGYALPEDERDLYAQNVRALLKLSDGFIETCDFLASECVEKMRECDGTFGPEWESGVSEELQWWWLWTLRLRREGKLDAWGTFKNQKFPFERFIPQVSQSEPVHVLNIGCGPRNTMGLDTAHPDLRVTCMDPLAEAYNSIMHILRAPGTGGIVFGAVEILDRLDLPQYTFISAANCLDHAFNVPKGMAQMAAKLADKGVISLLHYENEAVAQRYLGFHQWNIEIKDEKIHIWNKTTSEFFDHEAHGLKLEYHREVIQKGSGAMHPQIHILLKKNMD